MPMKAKKAAAPRVSVPVESAPVPPEIVGTKESDQDGTFSTSPAKPPIWGRSRTKTARTIVPAMARTNWKASVTATPQRPERAE